MKKIFAVIMSLVVAAALLSACSGSGSSASGGAIELTDMLGREIKLDAPAEKIVALTASDCEILYAIGAGDTVIGRGEYCDYPAEVLEIESVQSGYETNIEQIIALGPQVVLMDSMAQSSEGVDALEAAGITVVVNDAADIEGVYTSIEIIGEVTGKNDEAKALIDSMKSEFEELEELASSKSISDDDNDIYFEVSPLEYGLWAAGNGSFMNEVADMIGLDNIFEDMDAWAEVSEEQVIERDPDYIVTIAMYFGEGPTPEEEILSRSGWENVSAVENDKIFDLQNNELSRPGPRLVDGAKALYEFVYGE